MLPSKSRDIIAATSVELEKSAQRMARLLEEAQRLMAERDPQALLQQVCAAARPLTQASIVGVVIVDGSGVIDDFVAVGLDARVVDELRQSMAGNHDHPARAVFEAREIVRGVNPTGDPAAICLPSSHPPVHSYVFVPVASSSRVYGWLALVEKEHAQVFSEEDTQLASTLGALAGMGVRERPPRRAAPGANEGTACERGADRDVEEIVRAAGRAATLTKQLLAFSRRHMVETAVYALTCSVGGLITLCRVGSYAGVGI